MGFLQSHEDKFDNLEQSQELAILAIL